MVDCKQSLKEKGSKKEESAHNAGRINIRVSYRTQISHRTKPSTLSFRYYVILIWWVDGHIRAIYTRENKLRLNYVASYPRREHTRINGQFLLSRAANYFGTVETPLLTLVATNVRQ